MTRKEFLEYAVKQQNFNNRELAQYSIEKIQKKLGNNSDFIFNFLFRDGFNGDLSIEQLEENGLDWLHIVISCRSHETFYWEDIGQFVAAVVGIAVYNCPAEKIYLSQDGRFWDENHQLKFETEEELFDYLTTVEYDQNSIISEKTYEMLRHFGWHKNRCADTTELEKELKSHEIFLSQIQLDAIRKFGGLVFKFSRQHDYQEFYSPNYLIEKLRKDDLLFTRDVYNWNQTRLLGRNVLEFGTNDIQILSISESGQIFVDGLSPFCRNTLEYIHHVCQNLGDNVVWL